MATITATSDPSNTSSPSDTARNVRTPRVGCEVRGLGPILEGMIRTQDVTGMVRTQDATGMVGMEWWDGMGGMQW